MIYSKRHPLAAAARQVKPHDVIDVTTFKPVEGAVRVSADGWHPEVYVGGRWIAFGC